MARKYQRLYIGRCRENADSIELSFRKKSWSVEGGFDEDVLIEEFCVDEFYRVTGIYLEVGELHKVEINMKLLD